MAQDKIYEGVREKPEGTRFVSHIGRSVITDVVPSRDDVQLDFNNVKYTFEVEGSHTESVTYESESKVWTERDFQECTDPEIIKDIEEGLKNITDGDDTSSEVSDETSETVKAGELSPPEEKKDGRRGKRNR